MLALGTKIIKRRFYGRLLASLTRDSFMFDAGKPKEPKSLVTSDGSNFKTIDNLNFIVRN